MNELVPSPAPAVLPALFAPTPKGAKRFVEFFTTQIAVKHHLLSANHPDVAFNLQDSGNAGGFRGLRHRVLRMKDLICSKLAKVG